MNKNLLMLAILVFLSSCAHTFMRGTVAMKLDDKKAHICLGNNDVKLGDKVEFFQNQCSDIRIGTKEGGDIKECRLQKVGQGNITKLLNSHYSEVETDGTFKIKEGGLVQKL